MLFYTMRTDGQSLFKMEIVTGQMLGGEYNPIGHIQKEMGIIF